MLTRDQILGQRNYIAATVDAPDLGGTLGIRRLSFSEAMRLASAGQHVGVSEGSHERFLVDLVLACACDETGQRLFSDADADAVADLPARALQRIADAALEANGLTGEAVEDAAGNSVATRDGGGS